MINMMLFKDLTSLIDGCAQWVPQALLQDKHRAPVYSFQNRNLACFKRLLNTEPSATAVTLQHPQSTLFIFILMQEDT